LPRVIFTSNLQRLVACPEREVTATNVREALERVFESAPALRDYILDESSALRKHVVVYVGGRRVVDRTQLAEPISPDSEIYVLQALSGG
jgi:molybdopterin synthase sulfur carrier subunit